MAFCANEIHSAFCTCTAEGSGDARFVDVRVPALPDCGGTAVGGGVARVGPLVGVGDGWAGLDGCETTADGLSHHDLGPTVAVELPMLCSERRMLQLVAH